jgi:hypothetical protein
MIWACLWYDFGMFWGCLRGDLGIIWECFWNDFGGAKYKSKLTLKIIPKSFQKHSQIIPESPLKHPQNMPKSYHKHAQIIPKNIPQTQSFVFEGRRFSEHVSCGWVWLWGQKVGFWSWALGTPSLKRKYLNVGHLQLMSSFPEFGPHSNTSY